MSGTGIKGGSAFLQDGRTLQEDREVRCRSTGVMGGLGERGGEPAAREGGGSVAFGEADIMAAVTRRRRCHGDRQGVPALHVMQQ